MAKNPANGKTFEEVENEKNAAINEVESVYNDMTTQVDSMYNQQIDAVNNWGQTQSNLQQEQSDLTVQQIQQQKDQAQADYEKEQRGAYTDYQKQVNPYGVNAEQMASQGMSGTGYSESSKVAMYTAYQNRVSAARESYNKAVLNYDNAMTEARLQNSVAMAQIAYQTLQAQLELSLQGFQYKNELILGRISAKTEIEQAHYNRYLDVLSQLNTENSLAAEKEYRDKQIQLAYDELSAAGTSGGGIVGADGEIVGGGIDGSGGNAMTAQQYIAEIEQNGVGSYENAKKILKQFDIDPSILMTEVAWKSEKSSGKSKLEAVKATDTYAEYLNFMTSYLLSNVG